MTQIAASFVLLAGAGMLLAALIALQTTNTGYDMRQVLAFDIPPFSLGSSANTRPAPTAGSASTPPAPVPPEQVPDLYREVTQRVRQIPGVDGVVGGLFVPWRDTGKWPHVQFTVEGYTPANGEEYPYARQRSVGPGYFAMLAIQVVAGREFTEEDRIGKERVVIVSQSIAQRLFLNGDALNRNFSTVSQMSFTGRVNTTPSRIVGVVADVDDEKVDGAPAMTVYTVWRSKGLPMRMFVRTAGDPYALVPAVTRIVRDLSVNQAVERPATLEDVPAAYDFLAGQPAVFAGSGGRRVRALGIARDPLLQLCVTTKSVPQSKSRQSRLRRSPTTLFRVAGSRRSNR